MTSFNFKNTLFFTTLAYSSYKLYSYIKEVSDEEHRFDSAVYGSRLERKEDKNVICRQPYFLNKDRLYIFWRVWEPEGKVKGVVVLSHGLNEHSGRYHHVAEKFNALGFRVYALDHQGHGLSEGDRLYVKNMRDFVEDLLSLVRKARAENPKKKLFLLGHSMGGLIAVLATLKEQNLFDGAIYSSPAMYIDPKVHPKPVLTALSFVSKHFPKLRLIGLPLSTLCHDKNIVDTYLNEPLHSVRPATSRIQQEIVRNMAPAVDSAKSITIPVLMIHGTKDLIVPIEGTELLEKNLGSDDKTFKKYEGGYHELFNEPSYENGALKDVCAWLKQHL